MDTIAYIQKRMRPQIDKARAERKAAHDALMAVPRGTPGRWDAVQAAQAAQDKECALVKEEARAIGDAKILAEKIESIYARPETALSAGAYARGKLRNGRG